MEGINEFPCKRVCGDGVDGEIAPAQIVFERNPVLNRGLAGGIGIGFSPIRGDLDGERRIFTVASERKADRAELLTDQKDRGGSRRLAEFGRFGRLSDRW